MYVCIFRYINSVDKINVSIAQYLHQSHNTQTQTLASPLYRGNHGGCGPLCPQSTGLSPVAYFHLHFMVQVVRNKTPKQTKVHRNLSIVIDCNLVNIHYQSVDLHLNARVIQLHAKFRQCSADLPVAQFCLFMCLLTLFPLFSYS